MVGHDSQRALGLRVDASASALSDVEHVIATRAREFRHGVPCEMCHRAPPVWREPTPRTTSCARAAGSRSSRLRRRLRREPGDVDLILPFDEVVAALGPRAGARRRAAARRAARRDRRHRRPDRRASTATSAPRRPQVRARWERIAAAMRRGEPMPPIDALPRRRGLLRPDGHHRVSVARALGLDDIDARVTEVVTRVGAGRDLLLRRPAAQDPRAPLPRARAAAGRRARARAPQRPVGLRAAGRGRRGVGLRAGSRSRAAASTAASWPAAGIEEEYVPVVTLLREAGMIGARHRGRRLPARRRRALPAPAHARVERGASSPGCARRSSARPRPARPAWRGPARGSPGRPPGRRGGCGSASSHSSADAPAATAGLGVRRATTWPSVLGEVGGAGVGGELGELVGADLAALEAEVGVELRAHRLEEVDRRVEGDAVRLVADSAASSKSSGRTPTTTSP